MIRITDKISIREDELQETFIRSSGPGGQHANKVSTGVQLRFDAKGSSSLPYTVRQRLVRLAGKRITTDGYLVIEATRHRSQRANRDDALTRFITLVSEASIRPKTRRKTRPTKSSRETRLTNKKHRGRLKRGRRGGFFEGE